MLLELARRAASAQDEAASLWAHAHAEFRATVADAAKVSAPHVVAAAAWEERLEAWARMATAEAQAAAVVVDGGLERATSAVGSVDEASAQALVSAACAQARLHACDHALQLLRAFAEHADARTALLVSLNPEAICAALLGASRTGDAALVELLLLDERTSQALDASLRAASAKGHARIVRLLLDGRADPTAATWHRRGNIPSACLGVAAARGHADVVRMLLQDGRADPVASMSLIRALDADVVELLLQDGRADPTAFDIVPIVPSACLVAAAERGDAPVVALLLRDGRADPTHALIGAARWGHTEIVSMLLQDGRADPTATEYEDTDPSACLYAAAKGGHADVFKMLLEDGRADPMAGELEYAGELCLSAAAGSGHAHIVQLWLSDARVALTARNTRSNLFRACKRGHVHVVALLLADPRIPHDSLSACLLYASRWGYDATLAFLLEAHPGPENVTRLGLCLRAACAHGRTSVVKLLLQDGRAKPTAACLQIASEKGHADIVALLVQTTEH